MNLFKIIIISVILILLLCLIIKKNKSEFDYIVVGAGAAGCIVAVRLAEKGYKVALIDSAENFNDNINVETPYNCYLLWDNPDYPPPYDFDEWIFTTSNGRKYPRGVGWGGSSNHHAMVATRGKSYIYDIWAEMLNDPSWSFKNVLKYFKKSEKVLFDSCPELRGKDGWLSISKSEPQYFELELMKRINQHYKIPIFESLNCTDEDGLGFYDFTINEKGRRSHAGLDLLQPYLQKGKNIKMINNSLVTKIIFENNQAKGVEYIPKKYVYQASTQNKPSNFYQTNCIYAKKEIILSGGVINSPQILLLSGIGCQEDLEKLNIPVIYNNPEVGRNLEDHLELFVVYQLENVNYTYQADNKEGFLFKNYLASGKGPYANFNSASGIDIDGLHIQFINSASQDFNIEEWYNKYDILNNSYFTFLIEVSDCKSKGILKLNSSDPTETPYINSNLNIPENMIKMYQGLMMVDDFMNLPEIKNKFKPRRVHPEPEINNYSSLKEFLDQKSSGHHLSSSCAMGKVVDSKGKVYGVKNVRVIDGSIFPKIPTANPCIPTYMVAEKIVDEM